MFNFGKCTALLSMHVCGQYVHILWACEMRECVHMSWRAKGLANAYFNGCFISASKYILCAMLMDFWQYPYLDTE